MTQEYPSLFDPDVLDDPFDVYDELRAHCPVHQLPENGQYVVTRHADLRAVLTDTSTFSSAPAMPAPSVVAAARAQHEVFAERGWVRARTLQRTDPPVHTHYRRLLGRVFTPRRVMDLSPRIDEIIHTLIDGFIDRGECEFVSEFALPLPGIVIAEQLGLPSDQLQLFKRWADAMLAMAQRPLTPDEAREQAEIELDAQHHLAREFEARRREPTDDLISAIVHAHGTDDEPLSDEELHDLMHQLVTGGFETTTSALATAMLLLIRHPDQMQMLRDDPTLVDGFVEEALRYDSPVHGLWRSTTCPAAIGDVAVPEGASVHVRFAAANRDPEVFDRPDEFDITRDDVRQHVAFGVGNHFCIGAALARAELRQAFTALLARLDDIELAEPLDGPIHEYSFFLRPMKRLPLRFRPTPAEATT
ncbi:MAG: cytochrome P450 [Actinomycetota bacterium]